MGLTVIIPGWRGGEEGGRRPAGKTQAREPDCGPEGGGVKPAFSLLPFIGVKRGTAHRRDFPKRCVPANACPLLCTLQALPLLRESLPQTTTFPITLVLGGRGG